MVLRGCNDHAHNPAHAGSLVQIQPPQPILLKPRWLIAFTFFKIAKVDFTLVYPTMCREESLNTIPVGPNGPKARDLGDWLGRAM